MCPRSTAGCQCFFTTLAVTSAQKTAAIQHVFHHFPECRIYIWPGRFWVTSAQVPSSRWIPE